MLRIAILGSGPSANYLLKTLIASEAPLDIVIYETSARFGLGQPYHPDLNAPIMLANIASLELPPIVDSLVDWLRGAPQKRLDKLHVKSSDIHARAFLPRVALGAYFAAQFEKTRALGEARGHAIAFRTRRRCEDVICRRDGVDVLIRNADGALIADSFDFVVVATGHARPRRAARWRGEPPYPLPHIKRLPGLRIGVVGASLSALDASMGIAAELGAFESRVGALHYRLAPDAAGSTITLMSRLGVLPEADFYCPLPAEPPTICTSAALLALAKADSETLLDRAFALLVEELTAADPAYARRQSLSATTADTFAERYFAPRVGLDPFAAAANNLAEAKRNYAAKHVVPWRYAILRAHESFERIAPYLTQQDRTRFNAGLRRVFADNYAAVPHQTIERLLALRAAGVIGIERLGADYSLKRKRGGVVQIIDDGLTRDFDLLIDARGQPALNAADLPFPTLRMQALANALFDPSQQDGAAEIEVNSQFRLEAGVNRIDRVFFTAVPYLMKRRPFSQGLTSAAEIASIVGASLIEAARKRERDGASPDWERLLPADVAMTICANGAVVYQPGAAA